MYKGIVVSAQQKSVTVRIPELNKIDGAVGATPVNELVAAIVCTPPGYIPNFRIGDIVLVDFENDDLERPVVVGALFTEKISSNAPDIYAGSITVGINSILPEDTTIGKVTSQSIAYLQGLEENIQITINELKRRLKSNEELDIEQQLSVDEINYAITQLQTTISSINESINYLSNLVNNHAEMILANRSAIVQNTEKINENLKQINEHTTQIRDNTEKIQENSTAITMNSTKISQNSDNIKEHAGKISELDTNLNTITARIGKIEDKIDPIILTSNSYGASLPSSAKEGQLFFQLK